MITGTVIYNSLTYLVCQSWSPAWYSIRRFANYKTKEEDKTRWTLWNDVSNNQRKAIMPRSRIPEGTTFLQVDSSFSGEDYTFYLHPPLSGNTTCMNTELFIAYTHSLLALEIAPSW